ncbi:MAG: hypothetical protein AB7O49_08880 [Sphingomonadales bacterium]
MSDTHDIPEFPLNHIIPDSVKKSYFRRIYYTDIEDESDLEFLVELLWREPHVDNYIFWPTTDALGDVLLSAEKDNKLRFGPMESKWYAHPNYENDFVRIDVPRFDWEREVIQNAPMHWRVEVFITDREKQRRNNLEVAELLDKSSNIKAYKISSLNYMVTHYRNNSDIYNIIFGVIGVVGLVIAFI